MPRDEVGAAAGSHAGTVAAPVDAARSARRAFVRAHHPDVGGDPDVFREGLARLAALSGGVRPGSHSARVIVVRTPRGLGRLVAPMLRRWRARNAPPRVR